MRSGQVQQLDFRPAGEVGGTAAIVHPLRLKCVQWNIERGYKLDDIKALLIFQDADIICLQELDIGCERSHGRNCAVEIAAALGMKCAFLVEFEELHSSLRSSSDQGGGVHGNAILSKYDFEPYIVGHGYHPVDWERDGRSLQEPRRGKRAVLAADISVPGLPSSVICYCLHLEVFCGIIGRLKQFADVFADSHQRRALGNHHYQIIMGDLNTMAHGIARLSPKYCRDFLRFWSLGHSEGSFWDKHLFGVMHDDSRDAVNQKLLPLHPHHFSTRELSALRNSFFYDPFATDKDMTLSNHYGLYKGKLDWCLFRGFSVLSKGMDNLDYSASDHRMLLTTIEPVLCSSNGEEADPGPVAYEAFISRGCCDGRAGARGNSLLAYVYSSVWGAASICVFGLTAQALLQN
jgi:endonuclease/exonuclease/phosphatase family metal-dependent hydrolase